MARVAHMKGGEVVEDLALHVHVHAQKPVQELGEARVGLLHTGMAMSPSS